MLQATTLRELLKEGRLLPVLSEIDNLPVQPSVLLNLMGVRGAHRAADDESQLLELVELNEVGVFRSSWWSWESQLLEQVELNEVGVFRIFGAAGGVEGGGNRNCWSWWS